MCSLGSPLIITRKQHTIIPNFQNMDYENCFLCDTVYHWTHIESLQNSGIRFLLRIPIFLIRVSDQRKYIPFFWGLLFVTLENHGTPVSMFCQDRWFLRAAWRWLFYRVFYRLNRMRRIEIRVERWIDLTDSFGIGLRIYMI